MKKTMFITSVIMVVVMAIALTTSSLAWFSAAGSTAVTTSAFTITAKSTTSTGLQISLTNGAAWANSVDLVSGNAAGGILPAVPYQATSSSDTLLDALVGNNFISNDIDSNDNFVNTLPVTPTVVMNGQTALSQAPGSGEALYFSQELYIASFDTGYDLTVTPTIAWTKDSASYTYTSADPIVYVAVLADKNNTTPADRDDSKIVNTGNNNGVDYEIVAIFGSNKANAGAGTNETSLLFGNELSAFKGVSAAAATCCSTLTTGLKTSTGAASDTLAKITNHYSTGKPEAYGEVKKFKVIAWYDGLALKNANSGFDITFELTFTGSH